MCLGVHLRMPGHPALPQPLPALGVRDHIFFKALGTYLPGDFQSGCLSLTLEDLIQVWPSGDLDYQKAPGSLVLC